MSQFEEISRLNVVFNRIIALAQDDDAFRKEIIDQLNIILDDMYEVDAFGTEGEIDPRGDQRNGVFTMYNVEGYDE